MKKLLIIGCIALCVAVACYELRDVYIDHMPVAKPGDCVSVVENGVQVKLLIADNDSKRGWSTIFSLNNGKYGPVTYRNLREWNAKRVDCFE